MSLANCPWCGILYELDIDSEFVHLENCESFQNQPVAEWKDGKPFVRLPQDPDILVEKYPLKVA